MWGSGLAWKPTTTSAWSITRSLSPLSLFKLLRKDAVFLWTEECRLAKKAVGEALTKAAALVSLDYDDGHGLIIVAVDSTGYGVNMSQCSREDPSIRHLVRFESGVRSPAEQRYDAGKRECLLRQLIAIQLPLEMLMSVVVCRLCLKILAG